MTTAPDRPLFGGKSPVALDWAPLPYMDEYLNNQEVDGRAADYVRVLKVGLTHFADFCHAEGIRTPDEIKRPHIVRFQAHLNGTGLSEAYRQQILKYVRAWINWCNDVGYLTENPWIRIKIGSVAKKPKPLEDDEVASLFAAHTKQAFSIAPFYYHRREVILVLLYGWGLRIHELQMLNVSQMDMRLNEVVARQKGGTTKKLPYIEVIKQSVQRWLRVRAAHSTFGEDALLIDSQGKRLSIQMIRKIVTEAGMAAGISINPHRLRDTFGTTMLDNDVDVERVMKIMGHTNRAQTLAYARVNDHKVYEAHDRAMSPVLQGLLTQHRSTP